MARTYSETVTMYGTSHEFTADSTGPRKYGATYVVAVDGTEVARVRWQGGRRYRVYQPGRPDWEFITGDGGRVADVASDVCYAAVHEAHAAKG